MFRYIQKISDKIAFRQQDIIKMLLCFVFLFFILHYLGHFSIIEGNRSRRNIRRLKKLIKSNKRNNIRLNKKIENLPIGLFGDFYSHELSFILIIKITTKI